MALRSPVPFICLIATAFAKEGTECGNHLWAPFVAYDLCLRHADTFEAKDDAEVLLHALAYPSYGDLGITSDLQHSSAQRRMMAIKVGLSSVLNRAGRIG